MKNRIILILGILGGIIIGITISWLFMYVTATEFINNILPNIQIQNINFDLNETQLVNAMNNTFGGLK